MMFPTNLTRAADVIEEAIFAAGVTSLELARQRTAVANSAEFMRRVESRLRLARGAYADLDGGLSHLLETAESASHLVAVFVDDCTGAAMHTHLASIKGRMPAVKARVWALALAGGQ